MKITLSPIIFFGNDCAFPKFYLLDFSTFFLHFPSIQNYSKIMVIYVEVSSKQIWVKSMKNYFLFWKRQVYFARILKDIYFWFFWVQNRIFSSKASKTRFWNKTEWTAYKKTKCFYWKKSNKNSCQVVQIYPRFFIKPKMKKI